MFLLRNIGRVGVNAGVIARAVAGNGLRSRVSSCVKTNDGSFLRTVGAVLQVEVTAACKRSMCSMKRVEMPVLFNEAGQVVKPGDSIDYFTVFGMERTFDMDNTDLSKIYKQLQKQLHPDLFSLKSLEEQEISSEWSAIVNDGYKTLQKPLSRALYLLELVGFPLEEDRSCVVVSPEFLAEIMEINEELAEAGGSAEVKIVGENVKNKLEDYMLTLGVLFANGEFEVARLQVAHMKYYSNILDKILEMETEFGMY